MTKLNLMYLRLLNDPERGIVSQIPADLEYDLERKATERLGAYLETEIDTGRPTDLSIRREVADMLNQCWMATKSLRTLVTWMIAEDRADDSTIRMSSIFFHAKELGFSERELVDTLVEIALQG